MKYEKAAVACLLLIFTVLAFTSMQQKGMTADEVAHIPAGYSYVKEHDFRLNAEHPALMKTLSGLALLPLNPKLPLDHPSWNQAKTNAQAQWVFGVQFMYFANNNADQILLYSRIPVLLIALLLGLYLFRFAKELYGTKPALLTLTLFTFSPNLLAHSRFVTTDIAVTTFAFITIYYWHHALNKPSTKAFVKAGTALGLALSSKFTGIYLLAILPILAVWNANKEEQQNVIKYGIKLKNHLAITFVTAVAIVVLTYQVVGTPAFFEGLRKVIAHSTIGHNAYLMGAYSTQGWWYYFFYTFLFKTPIAIFFLLALRAFYTQEKPFDKKAFFILIPAIIFFVSFIFNKINIGHRHILPIYPFLFLWISPLANTKNFTKQVAIVALTVFYIVSSLFIYPHYLAYFNEAITPEQGHNYLIDSNIDWGQDLKGLAEYLHQNNIDNVTMAYFGLDSRDYRDITWHELKCKPQHGLIAISVNRLVGLDKKRAGCAQWLRQFTPIHHIGHSIHIYNISKEQITPVQDQFCKEHCTATCKQEGLNLARSSYNQTCKCACF